MTVDLVLSNSRAYVDNKVVECSLAVDQGKIIKIGNESSMPPADSTLDVGNSLVLPGLVDAHVHLRDEGKAYKEDFYTATAAAAAGGITTVLDMPNNSPVTMSPETVRKRKKKASRKILVNVGFYSEFPETNDKIEDILLEGAVAFKLYLSERVGGLATNDDQALLEAFKSAQELEAVVCVHAEDEVELTRKTERMKAKGLNSIEAFLKAHSEAVESKAVKRLLRLAKESDVQMHFCHISSGTGLESLVKARSAGMKITCEVTPHHLLLSSDDLHRIGTTALTVPPSRSVRHISALWRGVKTGQIDILASDHAPHAFSEKRAKSIWDVKAGIPGLETTLPLMLTEVKRGRLAISDVVRLMAENPVKILRLKGRGYLREGYRADFTIVDLKTTYEIDSTSFHSKAKFSPFDGWKAEGKPVKTFVDGRLIMDEGEIVSDAGSGGLIARG